MDLKMKIHVTPKELYNLKFYETTRLMFLVGKCGGLLPIEGLCYRTSKKLRFNWQSPYMVFVLLPSLIMQTLITSSFILEFLNSELKMSNLPGITFWFSCLACVFFNWKSARNFTKMVEEIENIEATLSPQYLVKPKKRTIRYVLCFYTLFGILDYSSYLIKSLHAAKNCMNVHGDIESNFRCFAVLEYNFIFKYIPFHTVLGIMVQIAMTQTAFYWSYNDAVFIICSVYLENKFDNFNHLIFRSKNKIFIPLDWAYLQFQYTQISKLVRIIDKNISPVIGVAFVTSFLLLCQQLFLLIGFQNRTLMWKPGTPLVYPSLIISTLFMGLRILIILFLASRLHTTSRKPLKILGLIPSSNFNKETLRFMDQVYHSKVALSGMGMFYFTRETILAVLSVVVTYELVLFQM